MISREDIMKKIGGYSDNGNVRIEVSAFNGGNDSVCEYHMMLHSTLGGELFEVQLESILAAYRNILSDGLSGVSPVIMRFFVSDSANQSDILYSRIKGLPGCAVSVVEQAPLDGTKVALWVYLQSEVSIKETAGGLYKVSHGNYTHYWSGSSHYNTGDSEMQTRNLLEGYIRQLTEEGCNLADNCIRTWFFVQNVDVNYGGVVKARNEIFANQNLVPETHYISSTGINGRHADHKVSVLMDTYAVKGLKPEQIRFLYASSHLNPTYEYGVSFERGTYVDYGDRRQVFISGTASINNKGEVMYVGNIVKQTERMLENVQCLLEEAECGFNDVRQMIVYLRDVADYNVVHRMYEERFPDIPKVIVYAPVCRPGWLIEMECIAVRQNTDNNFARF